ncbi:Reverse transcriptase domain [Trinorchestia longiramus]|nr:Reverse transcriptase domain [Trinorchestia longiramus]
MDDLLREFTNFTSNLIEASHKVFKKTKEYTQPKYNKSWWNSKCAGAVKAKQEAKIVLINQPSPVNLIAYKRCQALVKQEVKNAKKESWISFCNSITTDTSASLIWKRIKNLQTPFCKKAQPVLTNNAIITDSVSKANALANHYQERLTSPSPSPFPQHPLIPLAMALNDDTPSVINDPFNIQELNRGLTSMRSTATGHDDIHNEHLKHIPDNYKTWLLQLDNKSLQSGMLPTVWQPAIIIPLPKPNKPLTSVDSYRPIPLLSCVQKLMERLIVSRLTFFLEQKGVFRKTQGGYRRRLSAIHQVTKLEAAIRSTLANKSIMLCLFVDFSSAFDTVWPMGVLYKLSRCGVRGTMLRWLQAYLKDRPFKVFMEGTYSSERIAKSGVPQGAVLHYEDPSELLKTTEIGPWKVKCRLPANQSTSVGVIGPFGEDTSNEDLTEALKEAGFEGALQNESSRARIKSKHQCSKSAPRCVVCSGPHTSNECNKTTGRTCCNCGGNHTANYGGCPKIKQAKEVEKTRQMQKLSYRDAVKQVLKQTATPTSQPQSVPPTNTTLSRQQPDSGNLQIPKTPKTKTVGSQTIDELQTPAQKHVTINQLLDLLIRIFTAASQKDVQMDAPEMVNKIAAETFQLQSLHTPSENSQTPLDQSQSTNIISQKTIKEISRTLPPMDITPSPVIGRTNPHKKTKHNTGTRTKNSTGKLHNNNTASQNPTGTEFTNKTAKWIHKKN